MVFFVWVLGVVWEVIVLIIFVGIYIVWNGFVVGICVIVIFIYIWKERKIEIVMLRKRFEFWKIKEIWLKEYCRLCLCW